MNWEIQDMINRTRIDCLQEALPASPRVGENAESVPSKRDNRFPGEPETDPSPQKASRSARWQALRYRHGSWVQGTRLRWHADQGLP